MFFISFPGIEHLKRKARGFPGGKQGSAMENKYKEGMALG